MSTKNGVPFRQILVAQFKWPIKARHPMVAKKVTIHETDNMMPAINEINYMNSNNNQTSYHVAVDEKEAIQGLPFDRNGWHAGDGGNGYGNRNTAAYEICRNYDRNRNSANLIEPLRTQYMQARENAVKVIAYDMLHHLNIVATLDNIKTHNDWNGKWCPRQILNSGALPDVKARIIAEYVRLKSGEKETTAPTPTIPSGDTYTVKSGDTLWGIAGLYGVTVANLISWNSISGDLIRPGQVLKVKSGASQSTPAPTPAPVPAKKSVATIVQEVIDGKWGNNPERNQKLTSAGYNASEIQRQINQKLGGTSTPTPVPSKKTVAQVAREIMNGTGGWGNNPQRKQRLEAAGYNYNAVQAEVNKLAGGSSTPAPAKKTVDQVAREIINGQGGWGNNPQRATRLRNAGYDPAAVQRRVNQLI